jgi:hypothetical protein
MLTLLTLSLAAHAQGLVPVLTEGTEHAWKFEAIYQAPDNQESANHLPADAELWGGRLNCKMTAPRVDECTFGDGLFFWGWVPRGETAPKMHGVLAPVTFRITWGPTGRVVGWDISGERAQMQQHLAEAYADRIVPGAWRMDSPDFRRVVGQELEQRLVLVVLSGLDIELPKKGEDNGATWKFKGLPYFARRSQGGLGAARVQAKVGERKPEATVVTFGGDATTTILPVANETLPYASAAEQTFYEDIQGAALTNAAPWMSS